MIQPARRYVLATLTFSTLALAAPTLAPFAVAQPAVVMVNTYDTTGRKTGTIDPKDVQGRPGTPFPNSFGLVKVQTQRGEVIVLGSTLGSSLPMPPPICSKLLPANPSGNKGTNGIGGDCASPAR